MHYWFDNAMSRGTSVLIGWLALLSAVMIVITALITKLVAPGNGDLFHLLWIGLLHSMDSGTVAGDKGNPAFLGVMLAVTVGGIFVISALIGILSAGLDAKLESLRKGRSQVIETGHTVLLGWSDEVFTTISELVKANESARSSCVVILADKDKVEMEDQIRARVPDTGRTRIVCRTGIPIDPDDVKIVSPETARSIIVLSPDDDPDVQVINALLALNGRLSQRGRDQRPHIVAAVSDSANLAAARLAGGGMAHLVDKDDIAARLVVQTARQSGLSAVCVDLLDFDGDEFYVTAVPELAVTTFGEAQFAFRDATLVGIVRPDGTPLLNPPSDVSVGPDTQLIILAADDTAIRPEQARPIGDVSNAPVRSEAAKEPERTLMLSWNGRAPLIIDQLDRYVATGSTLDIVTDQSTATAEVDRLVPRVTNLALNIKEADTTSRLVLEALSPGTYDQIILLSSDDVDVRHADSRTLITLLHLRDLESRLGGRFTIVSEMNDDRNRRLAMGVGAADFIVSHKLISLLLTQISEDHRLGPIFADLFDPTGAEIYLKPVTYYVDPGQSVDFATVARAAQARHQTALGYRLHAHARDEPSHGVVLNPDKTSVISFSDQDRIIVLADE